MGERNIVNNSQTSYKGLRPLFGRILGKPKPNLLSWGVHRKSLDFEEMETRVIGGIEVPEDAICPNGDICTVLAESGSTGQVSGLVGRDVLVHTGCGTDFHYKGEDLRVFPEYAIIGVLYEGVWQNLKAEALPNALDVNLSGEPGVRRCRWCKSAGRLNILLGAGGYCPSCRRYPDGSRYSPPKVVQDKYGNEKVVHTTRLSKEEEEFYGGTEDGKPGGKTILSYPGQSKLS